MRFSLCFNGEFLTCIALHAEVNGSAFHCIYLCAWVCLRANFQTYLVLLRLSWHLWWCVGDAVMSCHSVAGFDDTLRRRRQSINGSLNGWYWMRSGEGKCLPLICIEHLCFGGDAVDRFLKWQCRKWWEFSNRSRYEFTELWYFAVVHVITLFIVYYFSYTSQLCLRCFSDTLVWCDNWYLFAYLFAFYISGLPCFYKDINITSY